MLVDKCICHEKTDDHMESLEFFKEMTLAHLRCHKKRVYGIHDAQLKRAFTKTDYSGIVDEDGKIFIEMLMIIPGISEDKARSIQLAYKNIKGLMDKYEECSNDIARENILGDIPIKLSADNSRVSKLGKALSKKVFLTFWSTDYNAGL